MKPELIGSTVAHAVVALFLFAMSAKGKTLPPPFSADDVMSVTPVDALPPQFAQAEAAAVPAPVTPEVTEAPADEPKAIPIEPKKPEPKKPEKKPPKKQEKPKPKPKAEEPKPQPKAAEGKGSDGVYESKVQSGNAAGQPGGSLLGLPGGTPGGRAATYPDRVTNKVYYMWHNPVKSPDPVACSIVFRIDSDGRASQIALERSSGMPAYDNAAVRAVYEAAPYPPFPQSMGEQYIMMRITFEHIP